MKKTLIIAEAGVNHNGDINLAKKLIDAAKEAGADYVKFQTFKAENLVTKSSIKAEYQRTNIESSDNSQYSMLKKLELDSHSHRELMQYAKVRDIKFLSTPFDIESTKFLFDLGIDIFKVASGEMTNLPFLRKIASYGLPVILSTGMCSLADIETALSVLTGEGLPVEKISVLHCNTEYPTPWTDVNLKAMVTIAQAFKVNAGYSDHTKGIEVAIAAVALGASIIEKHFTLDRQMSGPDHKASLEPDELKLMVESIRNIELALGDGVKKLTESEAKNVSVARKSIVASTEIKRGETFTEANLTTKRPGTGISPMLWDRIVGATATRDFDVDDLIEL